MARLIYSVIASLDGYSADETGRFGWATSDWATSDWAASDWAASDGPLRTGAPGRTVFHWWCGAPALPQQKLTGAVMAISG